MSRSLLLLACCLVVPGIFSLDTAAQTVQVPKTFYISPTDSTIIWKELTKKYDLRSSDDASALLYDRLQTQPKGFIIKPKKLEAADAASMDPGILYTPEETRQPAGIVVTPQKQIDPEMIIDLKPFVKKKHP